MQYIAREFGQRCNILHLSITAMPVTDTHAPLLKSISARIRALRTSREWTVKELARRAQLSPRFISSLESGEANVSIVKLAQVADALAVPLEHLVSREDGVDATNGCITLLGLRGAGKSTLGHRLAAELNMPFLELDLRIEELAGLSRSEIFTLHGDAHYRELEAKALDQAFAEGEPRVIAVSGGIITNKDAFDRCLGETLCVWLQATPEAHLQRVRAQGDERPMADRKDAMADLKRLLGLREPLYKRAHIHVDTTKAGIDETLDTLKRALATRSETPHQRNTQ